MRESLDDILNEDDFYSRPVLPETPSPKEEYKLGADTSGVGKIPMETSSTPATATAFTSSSSHKTGDTCSECGSIVSPTAKFCTVCGNKIEKENPLACPECGYITKPGDNFCKSCGHKLTKDLYCSQCGVKVSENQSFCTKCGNKL